MTEKAALPPYPASLAGTLLAAREAVMAPLRPHLRAAGVTDQQWRVLRVLAAGRPLDAGQIARLALLHAPTVTRILRELGARGLLSRTIDSVDRRRTLVSITVEGSMLVSHTADHTRAVLRRYEDAFGAARLGALIAELASLTQVLESIAPEDAGAGAADF